MRLPIIPLVVAASLFGAAWYFFNAAGSKHRTLDVPHITRLADIDGIETEAAVAPDGNRIAVIAGGNLWLLNLTTAERKQITKAAESVSFPDWTPDGKRITFTRKTDTFGVDPTTG